MPCYPGMRYPGGTVQRSVLEKTDDYSQARTRYRSLPDAEKARLADATLGARPRRGKFANDSSICSPK